MTQTNTKELNVLNALMSIAILNYFLYESIFLFMNQLTSCLSRLIKVGLFFF